MDTEAIDTLDDPREWVRHATEACLQHWLEAGARYERHLQRGVLQRDGADDLLALAARRVLPLPRRVVRPLPDERLPALAQAFNRLDRADRRALLALASGGPGPPGADLRVVLEHRASAVQRLVDGALGREQK